MATRYKMFAVTWFIQGLRHQMEYDRDKFNMRRHAPKVDETASVTLSANRKKGAVKFIDQVSSPPLA